jgi:GT2 family glycosyltransferase
VLPNTLHNGVFMSISDRPRPSPTPPTTAVVAAAVNVRSGSGLDVALDALEQQSYETAYVAVVGGSEEARAVTRSKGVDWVPDMPSLIEELPPTVTHVWMLHDDAVPRRSALASLVEGAEMVDASVAGSKLLRSATPNMLESVGAATDAFLVPYSGLDSDEMDQSQYDVVRDVAFVSGASALIRKDLFKGLGGPDRLLGPQAAGVDLSQRARLAGGRIVVVPSSEVVHAGECLAATPLWKEEAGRLRTMLKVYRAITLSWTVPLALVTGLLYALAMTFLGRRRAVLDLVLGWGWNVLHVRSTLEGRRRLMRSRMVGDEELFRYQVRGSVLMRRLVDRLSARVHVEEELADRWSDVVERSRAFWHEPGFYATLLGLVLLLVAGRSLISEGVPSVGLALPLPESAWATLRSYAGGWNTSGLGSPAPLHPSVGATALVQLVLFSNPRLAEVLLTVGVAGFGLVGMVRLLRGLGLAPFARYAAAVALLGGPATRILLATGDWPGLVAIAAAPWAVSSVLAPLPNRRLARAGYVARATLAIATLAVFAPVAILLPLVVAVLRVVVTEEGSWKAVARTLPPTLLALPFLFPWLYWISLDELLEGGTASAYVPSWWVIGALTGALVIGLLVGDRRTAGLIGLGGTLAVGGSLVARTAGLEVGREPVVAGYVAAAVGTALVVGVAVDLPSRLSDARLWRVIGGRAASLAGFVVALGMVLMVPGGRLGLPAGEFNTQLQFATARAQDHGSDRILLVGAADDLPGESRRGPGFSYRVVAGTGPTYPEAWLPAPRDGDDALGGLLDTILEGNELRPGESLAPFGIRWIVFTQPTSLEVAFESQLDLKELPGLEYTTFESEVFSPRAVGSDGLAWRWERPDYTGPINAVGPVLVAENRHEGWGDDPGEPGWANQVAPTAGLITFEGDAVNRAWALGAGVLLIILMGLAVTGRSGRSSR